MLYTAENYPAGPIVQSSCACGAAAFALEFDGDEGCAQRRCEACGLSAFIADEDYWEEAEPAGAQCPCRAETFEIAVAFSLREDGDVRWVTVGGRCTACGILDCYADWKVDYSPTDHLLTAT